MRQVFVFDPTAKDELSKVRGIGRYMSLLHTAFGHDLQFTNKIASIPKDSIFINPFFDMLKAPLTIQRAAKTQIAIVHDLIPLKYPEHFPAGFKGKINMLLNSFAIRNYDIFVTISQATRKDLIDILHVSEDKIRLIHPSIDDLFFSDEKVTLPKNIPSKYFLYVGDATWNKNLVTIATAVKYLNVPCVFVGKTFTMEGVYDNAWERSLKHFLNLAKNDNKFIFPGFISNEELIAMYRNAIATILVSHDEGFGFPYFESSAQKTPTILSDIPIFHEVAKNNAMFVNPNNPSALADVMKFLEEKPEKSSSLGKKAFEHVKKFKTQTFIAQWKELLDTLQ